ncbi:hypothetical protein JOD03_001571 [Chryseomicrobium aureum]|uniref:hypothetical protein n=1 Tax=Chryseomicrobium aureum TaxID=1441723 RepID=UPI001959464F|nr:hypothetical protein [Chryseomicrobium aureum]MBM7706668.1 hypothetical protein [Chryseomicrobium aureum]
MMDSIRENKRAAFLLGGALIALILAGVYYLYILPLQGENDAKRNANALIQAEIAVLQQQTAEEEGELPLQDDPYELMKKVPNQLEIDKIIRTIEEIELITATNVGSVSFNGYDSEGVTGFVEEEEEEVVNEEPEEQAETPETDDETPEPGDSSTEAREEAAEGETPVSTISVADLPLELRMITMTIDVTAETEEQLVAIMKEIENLERVYRIDALDTGLPGEEQIATEAEEQISASLTITTFYYIQ